jgi:hypothetical protein
MSRDGTEGGGLFHDPPGVTAQRKKSSQPPLSALSHQGFFFVAECDEISNLILIDDICKILEFIDDKVTNKSSY